MPPISFSDAEMDRIRDAAAMLPAEKRGQFLRVVANRLGGFHKPTPANIEQAIASALSAHGIAAGRGAFKRRPEPKFKQRARPAWPADCKGDDHVPRR